MDSCFQDVTLEFLSVAFHNILYFASVYPRSIFVTRKKYNIVVFRSIHPEVNQYLNMCLKRIAECLKRAPLRVDFVITDHEYKPIINFMFDFDKQESYDDTKDPYLVQAEQNIRSFLLKLAAMEHKLQDLPDDISFSIFLHTNESTAVAMTTNPDFEEFPLIELEKSTHDLDKITPMRRFAVRQYNVETYVEIK